MSSPEVAFTFRSISLLASVLLLVFAAAVWHGWSKDTYIYVNRLEYWRPGALPTSP